MRASSTCSSSVLDQLPNRHGITDEEEGAGTRDHHDASDSVSSSSERSNFAASESDFTEEEEEGRSPASSGSGSPDRHPNDPLQDMSDLLQQLPFKRGLSKHYQGKSQSFTSLSKVRSLEDLAKPENPYNKRLKSCKSYGGLRRLSEAHGGSRTKAAAFSNGARPSGSSCSSLSTAAGNRHSGFTVSRPPVPPHRSTSANTMSLFA